MVDSTSYRNFFFNLAVQVPFFSSPDNRTDISARKSHYFMKVTRFTFVHLINAFILGKIHQKSLKFELFRMLDFPRKIKYRQGQLNPAINMQQRTFISK